MNKCAKSSQRKYGDKAADSVFLMLPDRCNRCLCRLVTVAIPALAHVTASRDCLPSRFRLVRIGEAGAGDAASHGY